MVYSIKHLLHIAAPVETVYKAIASVEGLTGWWTVQTSGDYQMGGILQFRFGDYGGPDMEVTALTPNKFVSWKCIVGTEDWIGTTFSFVLDTHEGKTRVRFEHTGWNSNGDFYANCSFSWARYLESLRQLCQTKQGNAFGSASYK